MRGPGSGEGSPNVLAELNRILQQGGGSDEALLNFMPRERLEEAVIALETVIRRHPHSAQAYELLGSVYLEQGKIEQAIAACEEAIRIDPQAELAHHQLAAAHRRVGHLDQALASLQRAMALHPDNVRYYLEAAELLRDQEALEEALRLISSALEKYPHEWDLRQCRLELYFEAARYQDVVNEAQTLLRSYPDEIRVLEFLAVAHFYLGELPEALRINRRLLALAPLVPHYHLRMGSLCHELGDWPRALEEYQYTIELAPQGELAAEAWESIALLDESQLPLVMTLASESPSFRQDLQRDPISATRSRGFSLSEGALGILMATDFDSLGPIPPREITYY